MSSEVSRGGSRQAAFFFFFAAALALSFDRAASTALLVTTPSSAASAVSLGASSSPWKASRSVKSSLSSPCMWGFKLFCVGVGGVRSAGAVSDGLTSHTCRRYQTIKSHHGARTCEKSRRCCLGSCSTRLETAVLKICRW